MGLIYVGRCIRSGDNIPHPGGFRKSDEAHIAPIAEHVETSGGKYFGWMGSATRGSVGDSPETVFSSQGVGDNWALGEEINIGGFLNHALFVEVEGDGSVQIVAYARHTSGGDDFEFENNVIVEAHSGGQKKVYFFALNSLYVVFYAKRMTGGDTLTVTAKLVHTG